MLVALLRKVTVALLVDPAWNGEASVAVPSWIS